MYIVILGGGRVGLSLADRLIIHGYDVTIIESEENACNQATEQLDAMVIRGNGTDTKTLEDANIEDADVFIINGAGLILLLALMAVITFKDIWVLIFGG